MSQDQPLTDEGAHLLGVRFRESSDVCFFTVEDPAVEVGTWVLAPTSQGQAPASVVIAPNQVVMAPLSADHQAIIRVISADEANRIFASLQAPGGGPRGDTRLLGGIGKSGRGGKHIPDVANASIEDERFRAAKGTMPRLGDRVTTAIGQGNVISMQIDERLVTVRYDGSGQVETCSVDQLSEDAG